MELRSYEGAFRDGRLSLGTSNWLIRVYRIARGTADSMHSYDLLNSYDTTLWIVL